ncbi:MFS transporter [Lentzea pudingi]|uniref:MFS transporter n=1 Tax=Lentzea pudingi TaxID=1789439 RepID=A0ABQ2IH85_9PSEU|nr:MFS transporter [Lentzea pudingi]GGN09772.1 MFS transporter [Lentzea pudingi]
MPRSLTPLLVALLVVYSLHEILTSAVAPVAGTLGLTTFQFGLVFTVASVTTTVSSLVWGVLVDAAGPRPVLVAGLGLCVAGPAGFAAAVAFGADETLTPGLAFAMVLVFRSFLFGAGLAALLVVALAVAGFSARGHRTTAVGLVGATQGLAAVLGSVVGGALAVASLHLPLYAAPVIAVVLAVAVLLTYKPSAAAEPPEVVPFEPSRLVPAFGIGFLLYLSFGLVQVVAVYLVADQEAGSLGKTLFASGLGFFLAQGVLVPLLKWPADRLMRVGAPVALAGYAVIAAVPSLMSPAFFVVSAGVGLAVTGFAATASLGVGPARQGLVAGLVTATGGLTFFAGPMVSGLLYEVEPVAPVIAAGVAALVASALAFVPVRERSRSEPGLPD